MHRGCEVSSNYNSFGSFAKMDMSQSVGVVGVRSEGIGVLVIRVQ